jgi:hypothetical protein
MLEKVGHRRTFTLTLSFFDAIQVYKVRDVAISLLSCPFDPAEGRTRRATEYLREFSGLLSMFDASEQVSLLSLQSWIDTSRDKHVISL